MVSAGVMQNLGLVPGISPYTIPERLGGMDAFRNLLSRHVDFERIDVDREGVHPMLLLGAVDVLTGRFRAFDSHRDRITADSVIASAAIPNLFRAVHTDGGTYWDGLFSQNPPVRNLLQNDPDELWVVQVNPSEIDREPRTLTEIVDRRNELAGNLSLYQELGFIETIDELLADGRLTPGAGYRQVTVRVIEMPRSALPRHLGPASKLNRDPGFLEGLARHGRDQADRFLSALAFERAWAACDVDALLESVSEEVALVSGPPFLSWAGGGDVAAPRRFVEAAFQQDISIDPTHKQIAGDQVTWSIRKRDGDGPAARGEAEVTFMGTRIDGIHLGPRRRAR
jgi:NTE family protein